MATISEALALAEEQHQAGRLAAAEQICRQILAAQPGHVDTLHLLAVTVFRQGRHELAAELLSCAIALTPSDAALHSSLGIVLKAQGKLDNAVASYRRALGLKSDTAEIHFNLGIALQAQGQRDEAIESWRRALELKPDYAEAYNNLAVALQVQGNIDEAVTYWRRASELKPDYVEAHNNLGNIFQIQGGVDEAVARYRRTLELKPDYADAWSNLLVTLQYRSGVNLAELAAAHAEYDRLCAAPLRAFWRPHENDRDPDRPLRVGFVSPNFGWHPVGFFLTRALENLDRKQCAAFCYSDRRLNDEWASRLRTAAMVWRDVNALSDQELAEQIRTDQIDILFDLAGHNAKHRLLMFARKPAPIQVTWLDYVGTTGLAAMDCILADRYEIPAEAESYYRERVLRMPDGYVSYEPPAYAPSVSPLPALKRGSITFGSFNNRTKISSLAIAVWAKILNRLPQSRLVLKYKGMDYPSIVSGLANQFANHGVDPTRIECFGWSPHAELLREYNRIDVALDTIPYNGGLTTCEALWMGVPVITCPGETFASRHSLSHATNAGLTETIARDLDEYVELAVSLASDLPRLASLRTGLRQRMAVSPLCDGKRFAENLMHMLRDIWQQWCGEVARG